MTRPNLRARMGAAPIAAALFLSSAAAAQTVPTDPAPSGACSMTPATVAAMFNGNTVTLNGVVKAADSTQVLAPNCGFFDWSEQMFLWMTSPAPAAYGGGSRIMFSPKFFTVTPEDATGRRTFLVNAPGRPLQMLLRKTELGPHGLPALLSRSGHVIEVQKPDPAKPEPPVVRLPSGQTVRLGSVRQEAGALRFFDARGAEVKPARPNLPIIARPKVEIAPGRLAAVVPTAAFESSILARKIILNKIPIFIDPQGNVIDVEPGQADGGVLLSQNGSLIYYITVANDLYAYHRTMHGAAVVPFSTNVTFPLTMADANAVKTFAASKGHTILEPQALAVESKSSWIEATSVPNPGDYVQVSAVVPTFNKSNSNMWVPNGQKTAKVVMVGIHVVGSTNGHGEMLWATFEHLGNAPNAAYSYNAAGMPNKSVPQNTAGAWTFTPSGSTGPFNGPASGPATSWSGTAIVGSPVAATTILRAKPWGSEGSNVGLNTQVIAANASVISQLKAGDVRKNYFQLGTTWTIGGTAPGSGGNEVGTSELANATIESFMQAKTGAGPGSNCFECHQSPHQPPSTLATVSVSHVYGVLKPLP